MVGILICILLRLVFNLILQVFLALSLLLICRYPNILFLYLASSSRICVGLQCAHLLVSLWLDLMRLRLYYIMPTVKACSLRISCHVIVFLIGFIPCGLPILSSFRSQSLASNSLDCRCRGANDVDWLAHFSNSSVDLEISRRAMLTRLYARLRNLMHLRPEAYAPQVIC